MTLRGCWQTKAGWVILFGCLKFAIEISGLETSKAQIFGSSTREESKISGRPGQLRTATETINEVLKIKTKRNDEMDRSKAEIYENISMSYMQQDMVAGVITAYEKAIQSGRNELGNDHPVHAISLQVLKHAKDVKVLNHEGLEMHAQGDLEKAIQLFQEALDIYKNNFGVHLKLATICKNIAAVRVDQDLLQDAVTFSSDALKIRRRPQGDDRRSEWKRLKLC